METISSGWRWLSSAALLLFCTELLGEPAAPVQLLHTPDHGIQPQALMDASGTLHLVYLKGDPKACDVFYARREPGRKEFSKPLRVNSEPNSAIAVGTVRGAQLALGRNNLIHVVWNGSGQADPKVLGRSLMFYARILGDGSRAEAQRNLMTSTVHLDGGGSVAADSEGNVYAVWHAHSKDGLQEEENRAVFVSRSTDNGKTFAAEQRVSPDSAGVCSCCGLKVFSGKPGQLAILYRSATADGGRNATLLISTNYGRTFQSGILGPWHVATCPMSTMELSLGLESRIEALWETQGQIYRASVLPTLLKDFPLKASPEGNTANRKHPAFALSTTNSHLLTAWTEGTAWEKGGSVAWEYIDLNTGRKLSGRSDGVPIWGRVTAVAEANGTFTVIY